MKNNDNDRLLERKRSIDAERKAQAILRANHKRRLNAAAMVRIANARRAS